MPGALLIFPLAGRLVAEIVGAEFIVTVDVVLLQPVVADVKVNVTFPVATPVTTPPLVTVAFEISLLVHVPPEFGVKFILLPIHKLDEGVETTGNGFITVVIVLPPLVLFGQLLPDFNDTE